jgi:pantoate--beta-alanine ligase
MHEPLLEIASIRALRDQLAADRLTGGSIGLVPTMGALHAGHASLIREARRRDTYVVVSVFVNPLQFDRKDDLERYPQTLEADVALCSKLGVRVVFAPTVADMYPEPPTIGITVGRLARHLCGPSRPDHFQGVATAVLKLLQIIQPDRAYFGEKDAQQLAMIRRLVSDFNVPVSIVGMPTIRETDGLAISSRNRQLSPAGRRSALALIRALQAASRAIESGETDATAAKAAALREVLTNDSVQLDYLEVVDPAEMQPVVQIHAPVIVAGALWVDGVRLIDNMPASPPSN